MPKKVIVRKNCLCDYLGMTYEIKTYRRVLNKLSIACEAMEQAKEAYFQSTKNSDHFEVWSTYRAHWKATVFQFTGWGRALGRVCLDKDRAELAEG